MKIKPKPRPLHTLNSSTQEHTDHFISGTEVGTSAHQKDSWNIELEKKFEGHTTTNVTVVTKNTRQQREHVENPDNKS